MNKTLKIAKLFSMTVILISIIGCGPRGANKLTADERSSLKKLICFSREEKLHKCRPVLDVIESAGVFRPVKTVSLVGSGGEKMSMNTYNNRTEQAFKVVQNCIFSTYGNNGYSPVKFKSLLSELIAKNDPFQIKFISDTEREEFFKLTTNEEYAAFFKSHNADAVLIMTAYHKGGLDTNIFQYGSFGAGYTGLYAQIFDGETYIYNSGYIFTKALPVEGSNFCDEFTRNFEQSIDEFVPRVYNEIIGAN